MNILYNSETKGFDIEAHPDSDTERDGKLILLACALPPHVPVDIDFDLPIPLPPLPPVKSSLEERIRRILERHPSKKRPRPHWTPPPHQWPGKPKP